MTTPPPPRILFLCTGNSCRSQMAEGWARHIHGNRFQFFSAGIEKHGVNPTAVSVMTEVGIDISFQRSNTIDELPTQQFDLVISLCSHADEHCPMFPGDTKKIHHGFDDPPKLASKVKSEKKGMNCYRRVRDEIKTFISSLPELFNNNTDFNAK